MLPRPCHNLPQSEREPHYARNKPHYHVHVRPQAGTGAGSKNTGGVSPESNTQPPGTMGGPARFLRPAARRTKGLFGEQNAVPVEIDRERRVRT
jgi:hypothetical protein